MFKKLVCLIFILLTLGLFSGCSKVSDEDLRAAHKAYENGAIIIDVRSKEEFKMGHVKDSINIDIAVLDKAYGRIPKGREVIVYCRSGSRSSMAKRFLQKQGWTVHDVATQGEWERKVPPPPKEVK
jgi:phage shock protein E